MPCLALPCLALSMLCVQALDQAGESNVLTGVSVGVALSYSNQYLKSYPYSFLFYRFYEQDPRNYGDWIDYDESKYNPLIKKKKRCNFDPSVSLGYSFRMGNWHFGAVGEFSFGKNKKNYKVFSRRLTIESEISGFSSVFKFKGGYYFSNQNILGYGIAGMKWRNAKTQFHYSDEQGLSFSGTKSKLTKPQWILGVGSECPISKKLSIFAEYEYVWRSSKDMEVVTGGNSVYKFRMKHRLREHSFKLGVNYYM